MIDVNELTGTIPTDIGLLTKLSTGLLNLGKLLFSVSLIYFKPKKIYTFYASNLLSPLLFHIADNELKGSIPNELGSLVYLQVLDFGMYILSN